MPLEASRPPLSMPTIPDTLITIKLHHDTSKAYLEYGDLRRSLKEVRDYVRDLMERTDENLRADVQFTMNQVKQEAAVSTQERLLQFERSIKKRLDTLEENSQAALQAAEDASSKMERSLAQLQAGALRSPTISAQDDDFGEDGSPTSVRGGLLAAPRRGSAQVPGTPMAEAGVRRRNSVGGSAPAPPSSQAGTGAALPNINMDALTTLVDRHTLGVIGDVKRADLARYAIKVDVTAALGLRIAAQEALDKRLQDQVKSLDMVERSVQRYAGDSEREAKSLQGSCQRVALDLETVRARAQQAETTITDLSARIPHGLDIQAAIENLNQRTPEAGLLETLRDEVRSVKATSVSPIHAVSARLTELEAQIRALQNGTHDMDSRLLDCRKEIAKNLSELRTVETELHKAASARGEETEQQLQALEARTQCAELAVEALSPRMRQLSDSAAAKEASASLRTKELQDAVVALTTDVRGQEQSVLFGSKCLSCNREYDDVSRRAGVVDVRGEKAQAQLFAEVRRAMMSPKADPAQPIKMIAVKVGRTTTHHAVRGGAFEGRDEARFACSVEDLAFTALPGTFLCDSGKGAARRLKLQGESSQSRPGSHSGRRLAPAPCTPEGPRPARQLDGMQLPSPASSHGGAKEVLEFRQPLSKLLGRDVATKRPPRAVAPGVPGIASLVAEDRPPLPPLQTL